MGTPWVEWGTLTYHPVPLLRKTYMLGSACPVTAPLSLCVVSFSFSVAKLCE